MKSIGTFLVLTFATDSHYIYLLLLTAAQWFEQQKCQTFFVFLQLGPSASFARIIRIFVLRTLVTLQDDKHILCSGVAVTSAGRISKVVGRCIQGDIV